MNDRRTHVPPCIERWDTCATLHREASGNFMGLVVDSGIVRLHINLYLLNDLANADALSIALH